MEEQGFDKIDLPKVEPINKENSSVPMSKKLSKNAFRLKKPVKVVLALLILLIAFGVFTGIKVISVYNKAQNVYKQAKIAADAAKKQNIVLLKEELVKTKQGAEALKKEFDGLSYLAFIPIANWYYQDGIHGISAASHGITASITVTDTLIPYADVLGLKGKKSFVAGSAQDRIQLAVKTMGKVVPNIDAIEKDLKKAREDIDKVNENHYPNIGSLTKIREQIKRVKKITDDAVIAMDEAKPLIKVLPDLLGEPTAKRYLILFQNDKELRPTGGFLTFYAIFRIEHGLVQVERSSDMYALEGTISSFPPAPYIITNYLPKESVLYIRNSNLSPDFVESMKTFNSIYEKSSQKVDVDGIIGLDTHVLVNILDILGEVEAAGLKFNSKIDKRCDCPQVVYVLESNISTPVNYVKGNRKAIIGELLYAIMQKALSSSPKLYWGRLFQQGFSDIEQKHILLALKDENAQKGIEALNWAGRIKEFNGDYLHINDSNFGGQKSNLYVKQTVKIDYAVSTDRRIIKTVTIDYKNPQPGSDCNLERGGLCLNATLRDFLRLYVPKGSVLQSSKGSQVKVATKDDLGKTSFESFITVDPLGKAQIVFSYELPFKPSDSNLPVLIQKQPGTDKIPYEISVNGKTVSKFDLVSDHQTNLKVY